MLPSLLRQRPPGKFSKLIKVLQEMAPLELAAPWDNVGLLVDCTNQSSWEEGSKEKLRILLTNDLTEPVAEEAIQSKCDMVITYHPTPFGKQNKIERSSHVSRVILSMV